jgi:hypothetical protein
LPNKSQSPENSDDDSPYGKSNQKNIHYREQDENLIKRTEDDISIEGLKKNEMTKSIDMKNSALIQKKMINNRDSEMSGNNRRQSVNEDILKGLRLSGNDSQPKKLTHPPNHLVHKNTLMGDVKISNRNLNDSEIQALRDELGNGGRSSKNIGSK